MADLGEGVHEAGAEGARRRPRVDHHGRLRFRLRRHSPAAAAPRRSSGDWGLERGISGLPSRTDPPECPTGVCVNWEGKAEEGVQEGY